MKTTFTPDQLKPGYVCKLRNGNFVGVYNAIVDLFGREGVCISGEKDWVPVEHYNEKLNLTVTGIRDKELDIMEVFGLAHPNTASHLSAEGRKLLWKRPEEVSEKTEKTEGKNRYDGLTVDEATEKFKADMCELGMDEEAADELAKLGRKLAKAMAMADVIAEFE